MLGQKVFKVQERSTTWWLSQDMQEKPSFAFEGLVHPRVQVNCDKKVK